MKSGKVIKHCPFLSMMYEGSYSCTIDGKPLYSTIPLDPLGICPLRDGGIMVEIDQAASSWSVALHNVTVLFYKM